MFCPVCGSKINDDARFCTECGTPLASLRSAGDVEADEASVSSECEVDKTERADPVEDIPAEASAAVSPTAELAPEEAAAPAESASFPAPQQSKRSSMMSFLMERRQIGNRLVPTFTIIIASIIAAAGIAYAAFMLYKNVIEPSMQQPAQQEQVAKRSKKKSSKKSEIKREEKDEAADQQEQQSQQLSQNEQAHAAYDEVLNQYREAFAAGLSGTEEDSGVTYSGPSSNYWTDDQQNSRFPLVNYNMVYADNTMNDASVENTYYLHKDLDSDGVDELLVGYVSSYTTNEDGTALSPSSRVLAVYRFVDGQARGLLSNTGYRDWAYLCKNGVLCQYGNSGWASNNWTFFRMSNGQVSTIQTIDEMPDYGSNIATVTCKGEVNETAGDSTEGISNSGDLTNCQALIQKVSGDYPLDDSAAWQPLNS